MVSELFRRQRELTTIIAAKDKEIEDYKSQGVRTSRSELVLLFILSLSLSLSLSLWGWVSQLFPGASLVRASAPESRSGMIAEQVILELLLAVNYSSCLSPPPRFSSISPQSCTAGHRKVLVLKFTQTPNMPNTIASVFMQEQSHLMQNQTQHQTVHGSHTKSVTYNNILRCMDFFFNKTTCMHHDISIFIIRNTHFKLGFSVQTAPR